jgi:hypothetical protein
LALLLDPRQLFALRGLKKGGLDLREQRGADIVSVPAIRGEDSIPDVAAAGVDLRGDT